MSPFIETICIEGGSVLNPSAHHRRLNATRRTIYGELLEIDLLSHLHPQGYTNRTKCRVEYDRELLNITYTPYTLRPVHSLQPLECPGITYTHKSSDRQQLNHLFTQRGSADEVLILRHGLLTDTSIHNIALWDGHRWYTPLSPLLCGTQRESLLAAGILHPTQIAWEDVHRFRSIRLFNALIPFGEVELSTAQIHPPNWSISKVP